MKTLKEWSDYFKSHDELKDVDGESLKSSVMQVIKDLKYFKYEDLEIEYRLFKLFGNPY